MTATFSSLWATSVDRHGDARFLTFEAGDGTTRTWTYREFDDLVAGVGMWLTANGAGPGRGVHLALTNTPTFVAAWLAATRLGSYIVPSDPGATARELADHLARTRPAVGLCATERAETYRAAVAESGLADVTVVEIDETLADVPHNVRWNGRLEPVAADAGATAAIMFTSGTTGRPKGVVITQANYAFAGTTMAAAANLGADHRQLVVLPMFHANAQYYSFAAAIAVGASVALMSTFSASGFIEAARRHRATHASLFAGPIRMILARTPAGTEPLTELEHCWFAQNIATDQYEQFAGLIGCRPRQLYGMTETIPAVLTDEAGNPDPMSMGRPTAGCLVDLHDDHGRPVGTDTVGEIVVGGEPGRTLFREYLDAPDITTAAYRGGWFRTGDRARRDDSERYFFEGRNADVLKVAGENVSVVEVELVIGEHPGVLEAVVVGAPDPIRDEVPVAFVVPTDTTAEPDGLRGDVEAWCAEHLAKSKRPHRIEVVAEVPRTSVGKIRKFLLSDAAQGGSP